MCLDVFVASFVENKNSGDVLQHLSIKSQSEPEIFFAAVTHVFAALAPENKGEGLQDFRSIPGEYHLPSCSRPEIPMSLNNIHT